ncbi:ABC transporter ATP-binding protein [Mesorhizobium sp. A623]
MSTIRLNQISKNFGSFRAVDTIDLDVEDGELLSILGPSGSGKSTTLELISGLTWPSSGEIFIGDANVTSTPPAQRNVGIVFQSYALFPHMSVFENIAFPLKVRRFRHDVTRSLVMKALSRVHLEGLQGRKPRELSGGQQQRVALARAIVFEPQILLLDEPLGALDRSLRDELQVELRNLQKSLGITTIIVTHDQEEALSMSDRVLVLNQGQVVQMGTPEDIYRHPRQKFVGEFIGAANFINGRLTADSTFQMKDGRSIPCNSRIARTDMPVLGMLRPEDIIFTTREDEGILRGTIENIVYLGHAVRYEVKCENGEKMVVSSRGRAGEMRAGNEVYMTWNGENLWVVPKDS